MTADEELTEIAAGAAALIAANAPTIVVDHDARTVVVRDGECWYGVTYHQPAGTDGYQVTFQNCRFVPPPPRWNEWASLDREEA